MNNENNTAQNRHYKTIGKMIRDSIVREFGTMFASCLNEKVQRALVAREAFFIMQHNHAECTAADLVEHGRKAYLAGLAACNLEE